MAASRILNLPGENDSSVWESGSILFVGTATTVIRYGGFTFLTDPNFLHAGDHAHLGYGLSSKRLTNPAVDIEDLQHIDFCLLSHLHGDHWDHIAQARLRKDLPVVTTVRAAKELIRRGFGASEGLDEWESLLLTRGESRLQITAMPGKHGPGIVNPFLPPVMGSMLEWSRGKSKTFFRLYISGDTLVFDQLQEIPKRYPEIDLALLHLGGTRLVGVLVTMDAEQGIKAIRIVQPQMTIPIHYNDYEVFRSPLEDFINAVKEAGLEDKVYYLRHGEMYTFSPEPGPPCGESSV